VLKKILFTCIAALSIAAFSTSIYANNNGEIDILFEHRTEYQPSRGVTFQRNRMMTERGMLDVHVLLVDLNEPYIRVEPVTSGNEHGRRETTSSLLRNAGAIGGINADFFGLAGAYSVHFGPLALDGKLLASNTYTNYRGNEFATFFIDMNNNPFFQYIRSDVRFYNNGRSNVSISTYNSVGHTLDWPVVVDRLVMDDTSGLNRRFNNLTKIVVDSGFITQVSGRGETVTIPENGYVLVLPASMAYRARYFSVGDTARLEFSNNMSINFANIQTAIGGGGLILSSGELVNDSGVAPAGRHPRSAVGVSRDGNRLILMTVDGRNHSVGATHAEMGYLLRRYGAYDAMHFDGGGSTTLVTSTRGENHRVANTVSEASERRVINALGVFDRSPTGEMVDLGLEMEVSHAIVGIPVTAHVFGEDEFWNRIPIDHSNVTFSSSDRGRWENGLYTPNRTGMHVLEVRYGNYRATTTIFAYTLAELQPQRASITMFEGQRTPIQFTGITTEGTSIPVTAVERRRVYPASLGYFSGDEFVATGGGRGYIAARIGDAAVFLPINVSGFPREVDMFSGDIGRLGAPASTVVAAWRAEYDSRSIIRMEYTFVRSDATQAAYTVFSPALEIPGTPNALRLQVYGDGSGQWLRGRVQDAEGNNHLIDFARSVDFYGWDTVIARLPNAPAPFTLDQIYMVSLNAHDTTRHQVFFYGLEALYAPTNQVDVPQGDRFIDTLRVEYGNEPRGRAFSFNVPSGEDEVRYSTFAQSDFAAITMTARSGGIFAADSNQWRRFLRDIRELDRDYVVILMDANPLNFRQAMEFELFHLVMQDLRAEGRMVFVVSATANETVLTMRDGIRYINLSRPVSDEEDNAVIRFWVGNDGEIWWGE